MQGLSIDSLAIGQSAYFSRTISESDVYLFAGITGNESPAHIDEAYAAGTFYKTRIAHGMLTAGLISSVLEMQLPGPGTVQLSQTLSFLTPVRFGDTVTAYAEVREIDREGNRAVLKTWCLNQVGSVVVTGEALVIPPK